MIGFFSKKKEQFKNDLNGQVSTYLCAVGDRIYVQAGKGMFNYKCFHNAVQSAVENDSLDVIECIYIDDGYTILHYINFDRDQQVYVDNTLGYLSKNMSYFKLRVIHKNDWSSIGYMFDAKQDYFNKMFLKWYHRLFGITTTV